MTQGKWLSLLVRHASPDASLGWDDLVAGYDFGFLSAEEIQDWVRSLPASEGPMGTLAALEGEALQGFENALWAAAAAATGKAPRPGSRRWARAQDRWRVALLKDAMEAPVSAEALAVLVEAVYENLGCPEDMLGLWRKPTQAEALEGPTDRDRIQAFIRRRELALALDL
jgi:hypothetical protein